MPWLQVKVRTESARADAVEEAFNELGAVSITYEDAGDAPLLEPEPGAMPLWDALRLVALFPDEVEPEQIRAALAARGDAITEPEFESVADREWERAWLDDWHPLRFGRRLWVAPIDSPVDEPGAVVVRLDPGLAFGTGTHATTALCLEWLEGQSLEGGHVLDFGCGSGILAIAALLLGAGAATAVDIDPQALEATRANAEVNGVAAGLRTLEGGQPLPAPFDVIVANILVDPLIRNAELLAGHQPAGGRLALAGLLSEQAESVMDAFASGYRIDRAGEREGWTLLEGIRR
jgi:ribosomal protein L11 methyltransferase